MNLPPTHDLVTLFTGHIKNISTHIYSGLPNVDIFPYTILNHINEYHHSFHWTSFSIQKLSNSQWWRQVFKHSELCLKTHILTLENIVVWVFFFSPCNDESTQFIFLKCPAKHPSSNNHNLYFNSSSK